MDQAPLETSQKLKTLRLMLKIDALGCCIAGLGIGMLALAGPLGIWLGISDFRQGFGFLQTVNNWAPWIAGGSLFFAISIFVSSFALSIENGSRLGALALVGAIAAGLAYYIPESFRPSDDIPPIHDITTNLTNPPMFVSIAALRADAPNTMEYGRSPDMTPEMLRALQQTAYPDIVPQLFEGSVEDVFGRAVSAMESLGWEIVDASLSEQRIEATDTTFWFRFKDDIVVTLLREEGQTVLNARSLSRVGISDVGKNAERLRDFFALL
ncbi:MAG: DUF1499 domain-containing protein [Pseudohongiellaceae bacterium]